MKKGFVLFLTLLVLLVPFNALSAEVVEHNGKVGLWFDEETATRMLQDLEEYKKMKNELVPQLELKIEKQDLLLDITKQELEVQARLSEVWQKNFQDSEDLRIRETSALRKALEKKDSWYRSPALYLALGLLAGGALSVGLSFGLQEARD